MTEAESKPRRKRKWLRRVVRGCALILGVITLSVVLLQTPIAKDRLLAYGVDFGSRVSGLNIEAEGLSGVLPFRIDLESLRISDEQGAFFTAKELHISLFKRALLRKTVSVEMLSAQQITLERLPKLEKNPSKPPELPGLPKLPKWLRLGNIAVPELMLGESILGEAATFRALAAFAGASGVEVDIARTDAAGTSLHFSGKRSGEDFVLDLTARDAMFFPKLSRSDEALEVSLESMEEEGAYRIRSTQGTWMPVTGELRVAPGPPHVLRLSGTIDISGLPRAAKAAERLGDTASVTLDVALQSDLELEVRGTRLDFEEVSLEAEGAYQLAEAVLALQATATTGDLNQLAGVELRPEPLAARVTANIEGSGTALRASLGGFLNGEETFTLAASTEGAASRQITLEGEILALPGRELGRYASLFEERIRFASAVDFGEDGTLGIEAFRLDSAFANATGSGSANPAAKDLDFRLSADVSELSAFNGLLPKELSGSAHIEATLQGTGGEAQLDAELQVREFTGSDVLVARADAAIVLSAQDWTEAPLAEAEWRVEFHSEGINVADQVFDALDLDASGRVVEGNTAHVDALSLGVFGEAMREALTATGTGMFAMESKALRLDVEGDVPSLVETLGHFVPTEGKVSGGGARFTLQLESAGGAEALVAQAVVEGRMLALDSPLLAEAVGSAPQLTVAARLEGETLTATTIELRNAGVAMDGSGRYLLGTKEIDARVKTERTEIGPLLAALGQEGGGQAVLNAHVSGSLASLELTGTADFQDLRAAGIQFEEGSAEVMARSITESPEGSVTINVRTGEERLLSSSEFSFADQTLAFNDLSLTAGDNRLGGSGAFALETSQPTLDLNFDFPNLESLGKIFQVALTGSASGSAALDAGREGVGVGRFDAKAENLWAGRVGAESLNVSGTIQDPFLLAGIDVQGEAAGLWIGATKLDSLTASVKGDRERLAFDASTSGEVDEAIRVAVDASGALSLNEVSLRLAKLEGQAGDFSFALDSELDARRVEDALVLEETRLRIGEGTLRASGTYSADTVDFTGSWEELPVRLFDLVGHADFDGKMSGTVTLQGSAAAPRLESTMAFVGLRRASSRAQNVPPGDMHVELRVEKGTARASVEASIENTVDITGEATAPLAFSLAPFAVRPVESGQLDGEARGEIDLAVLPSLLDLEAHQLAGMLNAQFTLGGTFSDPVVDGASQIKGGTYENTKTGTVLREIDADVNASQGTVTLALTATDGEGGGVKASGNLDLRDMKNAAYEGTLDLSTTRLMRRDDAAVTAGGALEVSGTPEGGEVRGEITLGPATFFIPDRPGPTPIAELDVTEINKPGLPPAESTKKVSDYEVALDVLCKIPGPVFIRGRGLFSEWRGDLELKGTRAAPRVTGDLRVVRGDLQFMSRRFDLAGSEILFNGAYPPSPNLNIRGTARVGEINAIIQLSGTPDATEVTLSSEPLVPQDEILSYILFGDSLTEITPVQALQVAQAAATLAKGRRSFLESAKLPVDRITLYKGDSIDEAAIGIGRYITDRIYVELQQGLSEASSRAKVRLDLGESWKVEGDVGADSKAGAGLFWERDY